MGNLFFFKVTDHFNTDTDTCRMSIFALLVEVFAYLIPSVSAGTYESRRRVCRGMRTKDDCKRKWGNQGECKWVSLPQEFGFGFFGRRKENIFKCSYFVTETFTRDGDNTSGT